jgi:hypothetical protein
MEPFVKENLKAIKELFFVGLDFMSKNFGGDDLVQYAMINKRELLKLGIEEVEIDTWLLEWNRRKMI